MDRPSRQFSKNKALKFIEKIKTAGDNFNTLDASYDDNSTDEEVRQYQKNFMDSLNALTATDPGTQSQLKNFKRFIDYQNKTLSDKHEQYIKDNPDQPVPQGMLDMFNGLRRQAVLEIFGLSSLAGIRDKQLDMIGAFDGSKAKVDSFSKIFEDSAEKSLNYIEKDMNVTSEPDREKAKSDMCLKFLGFTSPSNKINQKCETAKVTHNGQTFAYKDFVDLPHEERVCAVQDFFVCAEDSSSPACTDHNRRKNRKK